MRLLRLPTSAAALSTLLLGMGCARTEATLACGPGTVAIDGLCRPTQIADTDDLDPADTDAPDTDETADDTAADTGGEPVDDAQVDVYLLGGQSNMVGVGQRVALPPRLRVAQDDVRIYWSKAPIWRGLQPSSDYSSGTNTYFGPEMTLGRTLADAHPDRRIALIKHAVGGTNLAAYWYPGTSATDPAAGEGYRVWLQTVQAGLAALEAEGLEPVVRGMVWMQGEADATAPDMAAAYADNLRHLVARVREDTGVDELPFVAAQIDCRGLCSHRDTVNTAIEAVAAEDPGVWTFSTEDLGTFPQDAWHYQGTGQRALGERFAAALLGTAAPALPEAAVVLTGGYRFSYSGNFTVGWSFTTHEDLIITDLGQLDLGSDGLTHATTVGIWEAATASLLLTGVVPAAAAGDSPLLGGWRYTGVEPTRLPAGDYIIGLEAFATDPDYYVYDAPIAVTDPVEWGVGRHQNGGSLSFPIYESGQTTDAALWFGPNFRFQHAD